MTKRKAKAKAAEAAAGPPCPACGAATAAVDRGADTPPWVCNGCHLGWWDSEVTADATWNPVTRELEVSTKQRRAVQAEAGLS